MAGSTSVGVLKAVLSADVSDFQAKMQGASEDVQKLATKLQNDLEPRQRAINAAVKDFLGTDEIRKAQEYAAAIEHIGGVSALTEADQKRVNKAVQDAIGHYAALGEEAPKHLLDLQKATASTKSILESIPDGVKAVAGAIGVAFSAEAVIGFTKHVFDAASAIHDQSQAIGFSAEAFQRNKFAAEQSGASVEAFAKAANKLNDNLANGDKSTVAALNAAGLQFAEIRSLKPEEAWLAVSDAVGKIPDPMRRAQVAQDLFGKGAIELLPGMIEGYRKLGEGADVMSDATVNRLEAAQDAWEKFGDKVTIITGEIIGALLDVAKPPSQATINAVAGYLGTTGEALQATEDLKETSKGLGAAAIDSEKAALRAGKAMQTFAAQTKEQEEAADRAAKALEAYREKIQGIADTLTGKALTQKVTDLNAAFELADKQGGLTAFQLHELGKQLSDLAAQGATLPFNLDLIRIGYDQVELSTRTVTAVTADLLKQLMGLGATAKVEFPAFLREWDAFNKKAAESVDLAKLFKPYAVDLKTFVPPASDWQKLESALGATEREFRNVSQIAQGEMAAIARAIGTAIGATHQLMSSLDQISQGQADHNPNKAGVQQDWGAILAGGLGVVGGIVSIGKSIIDAFTTPEFQNVMKDVGKQWGVDISEGLAQQIADSESTIAAQFGKSGGIGGDIRAGAALGAQGTSARDVAELLNLQKIIADSGGLTAKNLADWELRASKLFDVIKLGGKAGADATKQLDAVLGDFASLATSATGVWDASFKSLVVQAEHLGVSLDQVDKLLHGQVDNAAAGIGKALGVTSAAMDAAKADQEQINALQAGLVDDETLAKIATLTADLQKQQQIINATTLSSQNGASAVAGAIQSVIDSNVKAGMSYAQAVRQAKPMIEGLQQQLMATGMSGGEAFAFIQQELGIVTGDVSGPALDALEGYTSGVVGLANAGLLTQDQFAGLEGQIGSTYASLTSQGTDGNALLVAMQGELQTAWELEEKFGFKADDATQALIDQAKAAGIVGEDHKTATDQMIDGIKKVVDAIDKLTKALTGTGGVTDQADAAARAMNDKLGHLRFNAVVDFTTGSVPNPYDYNGSGAGQSDTSEDGSEPHMAGGGVVYPTPGGTLVRIAEAGYPETILPGDWSDLARAYMTQPSYDVGASFQMASPSVNVSFQAPASRQSPDTRTVEFHAHYHGPDAEGWRRVSRNRDFQRELVNAVRDNSEGFRVDLTDALGV